MLLGSTEFVFPSTEIEHLIKPFVQRRMPIASSEWKDIVRRERQVRHIDYRYWGRRVMGRFLTNLRHGNSVEQTYTGIWQRFDLTGEFDQSANVLPHEWQDHGLIANGRITYPLHHAAFIKVIRALKPRNVLEIGSGIGTNLLVLSTLFPEITFRGIELTESGVAAARANAQLRRLPDALVNVMPEPPVDNDAHRRLVFDQGSAAALPYDAASFDMVISRLALEQMESIREDACSEIARVCRSYVASIEPFREFNNEGIHRRYVVGQNYFQGSIADLPRYGLQHMMTFSDWPHKVIYHPVLVVAHKL